MLPERQKQRTPASRDTACLLPLGVSAEVGPVKKGLHLRAREKSGNVIKSWQMHLQVGRPLLAQ